MARKQNNTKTENKTVAEKPVKEISIKRMIEDEHLAGKHNETKGGIATNACDFCKRSDVRAQRKHTKTRAFYAANS